MLTLPLVPNARQHTYVFAVLIPVAASVPVVGRFPSVMVPARIEGVASSASSIARASFKVSLVFIGPHCNGIRAWTRYPQMGVIGVGATRVLQPFPPEPSAGPRTPLRFIALWTTGTSPLPRPGTAHAFSHTHA